MAQVHFGYLIKMQTATVVQFYNKRRESVLLRHEIVYLDRPVYDA